MKFHALLRSFLFLALILVLPGILPAQQIAGSGIVDPGPTPSASNRTFAFSGTAPGQPDGSLSITFAVYADQQSATSLWSETQVAQITGEKYSVVLGSTLARGLPADLFSADQAHWLGVQLNGTEKRYLMVSVPYAMKAVEAERLGGLLPSAFVTVQQLQTILENAATTTASPNSAPGKATGVVTNAAAAGTPPQPATDFTDNNATEVLLVTQQGTGYAIHAITASQQEAILAENSSVGGTALRGVASATTGQAVGVMGESASPDGFAGVFNSKGNGNILSLRNNGAQVAFVDPLGGFTTNGSVTVSGGVTASNFNGSGTGLFNIPPAAVGATAGNFPNTVVARDASSSFAANQIFANSFFGNGAGLFNIPASAVGATSSNFPNTVVSRDGLGSFSANEIFANSFFGNGAGLFNIPASAVGATPNNFPDTVVARDASGGFAANQIFANNFAGNGSGLFNIPPAAVGATPNNFPNTVVARDFSGSLAANQIFANSFAGSGQGLFGIPNSATTATAADTPNTIVARDASGNFTTSNVFALGINATGQLVSTGVTDFSIGQATSPVHAVLSANTPTTCLANRELLIKMDAAPGQQLFICNTTANGWNLLGDGVAAGVGAIAAGDASVLIGGTPSLPAISVAPGGITAAKLAPNAVVSSIADGSLSPAKITGGAATVGINTFTGSQTIQQNLNVFGGISSSTLNTNNAAVSGTSTAPLATITQSGTGTGLTIAASNTGVAVNAGVNAGTTAVSATSNFGTGVNTQSTNSFGLFASSVNSTGIHGEGGAIGVDASSVNGTALQVRNTGTGNTNAVASFTNFFPGKLISGRLGSGPSFTESFSVDTSGNLLNTGALLASYSDQGAQVNGPVKFVPSPFGTSVAGVKGTVPTDTTGVVGIAVGPAATAGFVQVAYSGVASCLFDQVPNPGNYVGVSNLAPSRCSDLGPTYPTAGQQVLGRVIWTTGLLSPVLLFGPEQHGGSGSGIISINTGTGLTGGPITKTGTISIASGGVTNAMLQNQFVSVNAGTGLSGGGPVPLGGNITLSNAGVLSFNGRGGSVLAAPGDYSFSQIAGTATATQLPATTAFTNQTNNFIADQSITGNLSATGNVNASGTVTAGSVSAGLANFSGAATPTTSVLTVNDNGSTGFGMTAFSASNPAALFMSQGPNVLMAGGITGPSTILSTAGDLTLNGTATARAFAGDGSALVNVTASKIGTLAPGDIATNAALTAESSTRQAADTTLQSIITAEATTRAATDTVLQASIAAETSARQSDVSNLQTSINNVSAADAKLAGSNTFTAGTQDFSGAGATLPVRTVLSANTPATCVAGRELLIKTDATAGQQLFICTATGDGWNLVGDGAGGGVVSFNGRSGSVAPAIGDYSFSQISGAAAPGQLPGTVVYNNQSNTFTGNQTVNGNLGATGTVAATSFSGGGGALTGVNAVTLGGVPSSGFAQLAAANTFTSKQILAASTAVNASLNLPPGTAPAVPMAGDVWNTGSVVQYRDTASVTRSLVSTTQSGGLQLLKLTAAITPATVGTQACTEQSFTVSGIATADVLLSVLQPSNASPGTNIAIGGYRVSAANTVAIQFCNIGRNNASTPAGGIYTFALMR